MLYRVTIEISLNCFKQLIYATYLFIYPLFKINKKRPSFLFLIYNKTFNVLINNNETAKNSFANNK